MGLLQQGEYIDEDSLGIELWETQTKGMGRMKTDVWGAIVRNTKKVKRTKEFQERTGRQ